MNISSVTAFGTHPAATATSSAARSAASYSGLVR
jgi:hypothetical protein